MIETGADILLVEDDANDAELTLRALRQKSLAASVLRVRDGEEALDYLFGRGAWQASAPQVPRVILLDLKLPKVDGRDVLAAIRADERTRTLPVVVVTSSRESRDLDDCYRLGANSFVTKPLDFDEFRRVVSDLGHYWMFVNVPPSNP